MKYAAAVVALVWPLQAASAAAQVVVPEVAYYPAVPVTTYYAPAVEYATPVTTYYAPATPYYTYSYPASYYYYPTYTYYPGSYYYAVPPRVARRWYRNAYYW